MSENKLTGPFFRLSDFPNGNDSPRHVGSRVRPDGDSAIPNGHAQQLITRTGGRLVYAAEETGAPERIRTSDLWFRRPTLYPTELQARGLILNNLLLSVILRLVSGIKVCFPASRSIS